MEDMTHLAVLDEHTRELINLISHYNARANAQFDKKFLVRLFQDRNKELIELLERQQRALAHMNGQQVEPQVHEAEAVLVGEGGGIV